ncbi:hypothetical protein DICVIV_14274 [Dictyocaulus viviparus]|uniref:Uncharacterized protein n=1 Tax=Dictyocaulus viviparus TaxID=29172 RepID=A0A0D8XBJ1_DICVI|nr:hypothetical protein DICVIV_14274 [Dictyocaulus viviparus]
MIIFERLSHKVIAVEPCRVLWDTTINDSNIKSAKAAAFADVANVMNEAFPSSTKYTENKPRPLGGTQTFGVRENFSVRNSSNDEHYEFYRLTIKL